MRTTLQRYAHTGGLGRNLLSQPMTVSAKLVPSCPSCPHGLNLVALCPLQRSGVYMVPPPFSNGALRVRSSIATVSSVYRGSLRRRLCCLGLQADSVGDGVAEVLRAVRQRRFSRKGALFAAAAELVAGALR